MRVNLSLTAKEAATHVGHIQTGGKGTSNALSLAPNNLSEVASSLLVARMLKVVLLLLLVPLPGAVEGGLNPLGRNGIHAHEIAAGAHLSSLASVAVWCSGERMYMFSMHRASFNVGKRGARNVVVPMKALSAMTLAKTIVSVEDGVLEVFVVDARRHDDVLGIEIRHRARRRRGHDGDETCKGSDDGESLHVVDCKRESGKDVEGKSSSKECRSRVPDRKRCCARGCKRNDVVRERMQVMDVGA